MKHSILIIALVFFGFLLKAMAEGETDSYVKTDSNVYFGQDLKMGLFNTRVFSSDGTVTKIPYHEIVAYMDNLRLFEYLPVVCERNDTTCYAMMEYVTSRSGLSLYRYDCYDCKVKRSVYYVFKGNKFHLRIDQKNASTTLPFFGIKVV